MWRRWEGLGSQGYQTDREAVLILERSANVCMLVNLEIGVCVPPLATFYLYQLKRKKGTWLPILMFYASPTCRCCWKQHRVCGCLCDGPCQCLLCAYESLEYMLNFTTGWTCKRESGSCIPQPRQRPQVPKLGFSSWAEGSPGLEKVATLLTSIKINRSPYYFEWNPGDN